MKLNCKKENIIQGVSIIEKIIGRNLSLPILQNILLQTENNQLKLTATDLETAISVWVPVKTEEQGEVTIPAKIFSSFLRNLDDQIISLKEKNNSLFISQNSYQTTIKGESAEKFPLIPKPDINQKFVIQGSILAYFLQKIINSAAFTETKPELTGILFWIQDKELKLAATDSFRLAEATLVPQEIQVKGLEKIIIPKQLTQEIIRIYNNNSAVLNIYPSQKQIFLESKAQEEDSFPQIQVISKVIEGEYPDYTAIIPKSFTSSAVLAKDKFINQIRNAGLFASKINDIKLTLQPQKNTVLFQAQDYDIGEYKSSLEGDIEGEETEIVFNYNYLLEGAQAIDSDELVLKTNQSDKPAMISPQNDSSYFYILMPIRQS